MCVEEQDRPTLCASADTPSRRVSKRALESEPVMDAEIAALAATLGAIRQIHEKPSHSPRPFTSAILNTYKLDVLDFIRDADPFEANLFWYPTAVTAVGGPSKGTSSSSSRREGDDASGPPEIATAPRLPEPKVFVPPTPLRKNVKEAEARGLVEFDAHTLLKAAQRLLDNYHSAPRARKHIKSLLRKHGDVRRSIREMEELAKRNEEVIAQAQSRGKELTQTLRSSRSHAEGMDVDEKELEKLQGILQREQMEMMAIEQMMEDVLAQKRKATPSSPRTPTAAKKSGKRPSSPAIPHNTPSDQSKARADIGQQTPKASGPRSARETPKQATPSGDLSPRNSHVHGPASITPKSSTIESQSSAVPADETIRIQSLRDIADETICLQPDRRDEVEESGANTAKEDDKRHDSSESKRIQSSDELERICENIWNIFGDHLRFAAPERESGDLQETLDALYHVSMCRVSGSSSSATVTGDTSLVSTASNTTAATSGSSVPSGASLSNAGPPSTLTSIASHILITLLSTAPPHTMDFDEVKRQTDAWWNEVGRTAYIVASKPEAGSDVPMSGTSGNTLASKATYELVAKKLLRLRFAGKQRTVFFPANIL